MHTLDASGMYLNWFLIEQNVSLYLGFGSINHQYETFIMANYFPYVSNIHTYLH